MTGRRRTPGLMGVRRALLAVVAVARIPGFSGAVEAALGKPFNRSRATEDDTMPGQTTRPTTTAAGRRAAAFALSLAVAGAATAAWPATARADNSRGEGTKALIDEVPRQGTGWSNGPATLVPRGGGKYQVDHDNPPVGGGAARPGVPVIIDNADGNPVVERRQPVR